MSTITVELSAMDAAAYLPTYGLGHATQEAPPVRVWLPLTADQAEVVCDYCDGGGCPDCASRPRPVRAGDRVCAVTPCPDCEGTGDSYWVPDMACPKCSHGRVSVWSATITEVLPVEPWEPLTRRSYRRIVLSSAPVWAWIVDPNKGGSATLPGDWCSAVVGVRLSDVEPA